MIRPQRFSIIFGTKRRQLARPGKVQVIASTNVLRRHRRQPAGCRPRCLPECRSGPTAGIAASRSFTPPRLPHDICLTRNRRGYCAAQPHRPCVPISSSRRAAPHAHRSGGRALGDGPRYPFVAPVTSAVLGRRSCRSRLSVLEVGCVFSKKAARASAARGGLAVDRLPG